MKNLSATAAKSMAQERAAAEQQLKDAHKIVANLQVHSPLHLVAGRSFYVVLVRRIALWIWRGKLVPTYACENAIYEGYFKLTACSSRKICMMQDTVKEATMRASTNSSEKRRLTSELTVATKGLSDLKSRMANMQAISVMTAKSAAEERAIAEQKLLAAQQEADDFKVPTQDLLEHSPVGG